MRRLNRVLVQLINDAEKEIKKFNDTRIAKIIAYEALTKYYACSATDPL